MTIRCPIKSCCSIVELEAQVEELKTQSVGSTDGSTVVEISVDDISPGQNPRNILSAGSIQSIANQIERNGQDIAISIFPNPTGFPILARAATKPRSSAISSYLSSSERTTKF